MNIYGIGTDLVHVPRIEKLLEKNPKSFAKRILSEDELAIFEDKDKTAFLAKRFAAKEAIAKALGTGIGSFISFTDISILNDDKGRPLVTYSHKVQNKLDTMGIISTHISLSDEREYALAFVTILFTGNIT